MIRHADNDDDRGERFIANVIGFLAMLTYGGIVLACCMAAR